MVTQAHPANDQTAYMDYERNTIKLHVQILHDHPS